MQARLCPEFKGVDTLLIWGDDTDIEGLLAGLIALASGSQAVWVAPHARDRTGLTITAAHEVEQLSDVTVDGDGVQWTCSSDVVAHAGQLVAALTSAASGHQYIDAAGPSVTQVMIAKNEYP